MRRVQGIARSLGFVGRVEYRHVISGSGGAQFGLAAKPENDILVVDAQAFRRDVDPDDVSLTAIIAHERGHQLLHRHKRLQGFLRRWDARSSEEMMASIVGALLVSDGEDQKHLLLKATAEAVQCGVELDDAVWLVSELHSKMERLL